ncbi:MAG: class I SAM-dependent methyltransferase [Leptolyngbyaceae cyanobacterium RU_5_1]|nr:class I SAM-dependent methyltransferase [Leptolyngbyaceae cyanobacterium RU_5_1]
MDEQSTELFEKIRQQFDSAPYPNVPLEQHPKGEYERLFQHNLITAYYLRDQLLTSADGKVILDAGCGTGYKSMVLAEANPGAKIVGIDLSSQAVELARQRIKFHGYENVEFLVGSIESLPTLGLEFDYINCDEVLYLFPDIAKGLQAMKAVLKPEGIIRANLHSAIQRFNYFRAQQVFKVMGLMDSNPEELEMEIAKETFTALEDWVELKAKIWRNPSERKDEKEWLLMNYLFQGDKGYTIADLFAALQTADLEFISMVNWRRWEILDLFKDSDDLPVFWAMSLPGASTEQRLQLFELLHPIHRLLDFWCGHPGQAKPFVPVTDWSEADWQGVRIHLHPQLAFSQIRDDLIKSINHHSSFEVTRYLPTQVSSPITLESAIAARLLPLWDGSQSIQALVERSLKLQPFNPVTLEAVTPEQVFTEIKDLLTALETPMYILLERSNPEAEVL